MPTVKRRLARWLPIPVATIKRGFCLDNQGARADGFRVWIPLVYLYASILPGQRASGLTRQHGERSLVWVSLDALSGLSGVPVHRLPAAFQEVRHKRLASIVSDPKNATGVWVGVEGLDDFKPISGAPRWIPLHRSLFGHWRALSCVQGKVLCALLLAMFARMPDQNYLIGKTADAGAHSLTELANGARASISAVRDSLSALQRHKARTRRGMRPLIAMRWLTGRARIDARLDRPKFEFAIADAKGVRYQSPRQYVDVQDTPATGDLYILPSLPDQTTKRSTSRRGPPPGSGSDSDSFLRNLNQVGSK